LIQSRDCDPSQPKILGVSRLEGGHGPSGVPVRYARHPGSAPPPRRNWAKGPSKVALLTPTRPPSPASRGEKTNLAGRSNGPNNAETNLRNTAEPKESCARAWPDGGYGDRGAWDCGAGSLTHITRVSRPERQTEKPESPQLPNSETPSACEPKSSSKWNCHLKFAKDGSVPGAPASTCKLSSSLFQTSTSTSAPRSTSSDEGK
jgi:hypothetical protein